MSNIKSKMNIMGILSIKEIDKETGEVVGSYEDENVITEQGVNTLFFRMATSDQDNVSMFDRFFLGDDYGEKEEPLGGWEPLNPLPASRRYTTLNQDTVYDVPSEDMVFSYKDENTIQVSTLLDGSFILDSFFEDEVDMRYCSATMRFKGGTTFAYKRFPMRSLSRLIDVQIVWTFRFVNTVDFLCPVPPSVTEERFYGIGDTLSYYSESGVTDLSTYADVLHVSALPDGRVSFTDQTKHLIRIDEDGTEEVNVGIPAMGNITALETSPSGVSYVGASDGYMYRFESDGSLGWEKEVSDMYSISYVWIVNNARIAVSLSNGTDSIVKVLNAENGSEIYDSSFPVETGTEDSFLFSSSSGQLFVRQKTSDGDDSVIKVGFDLTELSRTSFEEPIADIYPDTGNNLLLGFDGGEKSSIIRLNINLGFVFEAEVETEGELKNINVNRDGDIFATSDTDLFIFNTDLTVKKSLPFDAPSRMSLTGSKWTYFI